MRIKKTNFSTRQLREIAALMSSSICTIEPHYKGRTLHSVWIEIGGDLAHFPSTSNMYRAQTRWVGNRVIATVGRDPSALVRLEAVTALLNHALDSVGLFHIPSFGKELLTMDLHFPEKKGRYDHHNLIKPICDWLERVGLYDNDTQIEPHPYKKVDYPSEDKRLNTLEILVQRRENVKRFYEEVFNASRKVSADNTTLRPE